MLSHAPFKRGQATAMENALKKNAIGPVQPWSDPGRSGLGFVEWGRIRSTCALGLRLDWVAGLQKKSGPVQSNLCPI
ncbi:hypothetical protein DSM3645_05230 [Blastopirellula marina DSM 3645]|uniref:Uncharacterized protein n=1 Tax=Blastopirellula marina DSM 3645 TaxID=314230 RepID=A3ZTU3_9BACT|nr:hypothetical protein DSM3645_05230 [Blastopirellula marina DSM 3645]